MYTVEYEMGALKPPRPPAVASVAGLNTHDLPTFASFWDASDIDERVALGFQDAEAARGEKARRATMRDILVAFLREGGFLHGKDADAKPGDVLHASLAWLGTTDARVVFAALEDLWGETRPQNVPGTGPPMPNWQRKARHPFDDFRRLPAVRKAMRILREARPRGQ
jgi:4-alpha-glucanotransferase